MNNILIVEDEHLIARLIEMTLTRAGYRCTVAEDGRTAADLIEKTDFDMAILDIMLPGLDGYELLDAMCGLATAPPDFKPNLPEDEYYRYNPGTR